MYKQSVNSLKRQIFFLCGLVLFGTGILTTVSHAVELYRCTRNGKVEFRQTACPDGEQAITEVIDQSGGISPIEPGLRLDHPTPEKPHSVREKTESKATEERCWKTRQRLEWVERRLRAGYKPSQSEGLHRKQTEYDEYLKRFCKG